MELTTGKKRLVASAAVLALLSVTAVAVWNAIQERAKAAKTESEILREIRPEELKEVLKSEAAADVTSIRELNESPEKRKEFLAGLEEHLALAAHARREGLADTEDFRVNLEYKTDILLADLYQAKLSEGKKRLYVVPEAELEGVWKDPGNEARYKKTMDVLLRIRKQAADAKGETVPIRPPQGEVLRKSRENYARVIVLAARAKKDKEFMSRPAIPLRIKILEAGILSNDYLIANYRSFIPTDSDVREWLASHPEYDPKRKLGTAKQLLARVKAGEDFDELAKKYSEDGRSSARGGLYEDFMKGALWPEVEARIGSMQPGEIAPELVESEFGYHIVKFLGSKKDPTKGRTVFTVKHIGIQKKFQEPGKPIPGMTRPFMTPAEIARQELTKEKREAFIAGIVRSTPISLPEDFRLELAKASSEKAE